MQLSAHLISVLAIGAALGLVSTAGIYFDPRAGGKFYVICAGTIRGALYGAVIALMIVLSHSKGARGHAIYVIPPSVISGGLIGLLIEQLWG
jgi:hypothetical protein